MIDYYGYFPPHKNKQSGLRYYIFAARWLWRNRTWQNSRQKFKAMLKDWEGQR